MPPFAIAGPRLTHSAGPCRVPTFEEHGIQWCTFLCNVLDCTRYKKSSARIQASSQDATQAAVCARGACNPKACVLVLIPLIIPSRQATAAAVNQASTAVATFFTKVSAWCFRVGALFVHASRRHLPACGCLSPGQLHQPAELCHSKLLPVHRGRTERLARVP